MTPPNFQTVWASLWGSKTKTLSTMAKLAFLAPSMVDPMVFAADVKQNKDIPADHKSVMIRQNTVHHMFSLAMEITSLIASRPLVGYFFRKSAPEKIEFYKDIIGLGSIIFAKSVIRPLTMVKFSQDVKESEKPATTPFQDQFFSTNQQSTPVSVTLAKPPVAVRDLSALHYGQSPNTPAANNRLGSNQLYTVSPFSSPIRGLA